MDQSTWWCWAQSSGGRRAVTGPPHRLCTGSVQESVAGEGTMRGAESEPNRGFLLNGIYLNKSFHARCPDKQACLKQVFSILGPKNASLRYTYYAPGVPRSRFSMKIMNLELQPLTSRPQWRPRQGPEPHSHGHLLL